MPKTMRAYSIIDGTGYIPKSVGRVVGYDDALRYTHESVQEATVLLEATVNAQAARIAELERVLNLALGRMEKAAAYSEMGGKKASRLNNVIAQCRKALGVKP